jgi:hypothetical protein
MQHNVAIRNKMSQVKFFHSVTNTLFPSAPKWSAGSILASICTLFWRVRGKLSHPFPAFSAGLWPDHTNNRSYNHHLARNFF